MGAISHASHVKKDRVRFGVVWWGSVVGATPTTAELSVTTSAVMVLAVKSSGLSIAEQKLNFRSAIPYCIALCEKS